MSNLLLLVGGGVIVYIFVLACPMLEKEENEDAL